MNSVPKELEAVDGLKKALSFNFRFRFAAGGLYSHQVEKFSHATRFESLLIALDFGKVVLNLGYSV